MCLRKLHRFALPGGCAPCFEAGDPVPGILASLRIGANLEETTAQDAPGRIRQGKKGLKDVGGRQSLSLPYVQYPFGQGLYGSVAFRPQGMISLGGRT